jgi:hypothetical protein
MILNSGWYLANHARRDNVLHVLYGIIHRITTIWLSPKAPPGNYRKCGMELIEKNI